MIRFTLPWKKNRLKIRAVGRTDQGKVRKNNEDSLQLNPKIDLYMVADGMGGHRLGDFASQTAVEVVNLCLEQALIAHKGPLEAEELKGWILEALELANKTIYDYSQKLPGKKAIGTTLTLALFRDRRLFLGHIGDSRLYRLRAGRMEKLTKDHNQIQDLVDQGLIDEEAADNHPLSHYLTRAVGGTETVKADLEVLAVEKGDVFLLTTDGLFRVLTVNKVEDILNRPIPIEKKADLLIEKTLEGQAPDNVSVVVVEMV